MLVEHSPRLKAAMLVLAMRRVRALGDAPGHEFHGNQYSGGGAAALPTLSNGDVDVAKTLGKEIVPYHAYADEHETENAPVTERVVLSALHPTQKEADLKTIIKYVKDPSAGYGPIDVYTRGEKQYIADGHHRVLAAIARGETHITADVTHIVSKVRGLARHPESAIHVAADAHLSAMTLAVMYGFLKGRKAYKAGKDAPKAIHAALLESLPPVLLKVYAAGGNVALKKLKTVSLRTLKPQRAGEPHDVSGDFGLAFNVSDPTAVQWAQDHAAELARDLSDTSEQNIKDAVARAVDGDGIDAAYDDILDAVGDEVRADMIARTEVMDAANEGLAQGWDQAQEAGLLPADATKVWIATDGCCDECEDVDGEEVALDEDFSVGDDPPLHPNCRCTMGIGTGEA